jgi:hypothetical protein
LGELVVAKCVPISPRTTTRVDDRCSVCGRESRTLVGVEVQEHRWSQTMGVLEPIRAPRSPGAGLFVGREHLDLDALFRTIEFPEAIFCTDGARLRMESLELSNLTFLEFGEVS